MKTQYTVAIATLAGIAIGGMAVQALYAQTKPRAYVVIEIDVLNQDGFFKEFVPVAVLPLFVGLLVLQLVLWLLA